MIHLQNTRPKLSVKIIWHSYCIAILNKKYILNPFLHFETIGFRLWCRRKALFLSRKYSFNFILIPDNVFDNKLVEIQHSFKADSWRYCIEVWTEQSWTQNCNNVAWSLQIRILIVLLILQKVSYTEQVGIFYDFFFIAVWFIVSKNEAIEEYQKFLIWQISV